MQLVKQIVDFCSKKSFVHLRGREGFVKQGPVLLQRRQNGLPFTTGGAGCWSYGSFGIGCLHEINPLQGAKGPKTGRPGLSSSVEFSILLTDAAALMDEAAV